MLRGVGDDGDLPMGSDIDEDVEDTDCLWTLTTAKNSKIDLLDDDNAVK